MLTYTYNAFTVSTVHSLIQCACTKSLQKNSGLWADFTPRRGRESISHCLALPVEGQKKVQAATHFHGEISLSYLQMPATGRIKKGMQSAQKKKLTENHLLRVEGEGPRSLPAWEGWNPQPPGPLVRAGIGGSRRGKQIWEPALLSGTQQPWMQSFAFRSTYWLCFFGHG